MKNNEVLTPTDVAIVGVGAARPRRSIIKAQTPWESMEDYATVINDGTAFHAIRVPLVTNDIDELIDRVMGIKPPICAAFVIGLDANAAKVVQRGVAERGGPLVITEVDVVTQTLAAQTIATLRTLGVEPHAGQVVITGADLVPRLGSILMASGIAVVTSLSTGDTSQFSVRMLMRHNDVLVDLGRCAGASVSPERVVTVSRERVDAGEAVCTALLAAMRSIERITA